MSQGQYRVIVVGLCIAMCNLIAAIVILAAK
jgi:hypothetical protein